ncbi:hypothetical protein [Polymorphospora sp. NPDC050346]|uniref:hypothetical protein n=1 Tax=Polymorphospora sp. NPDC050346 TaxID=3155780 RepID=UPI00340B62C9
MLTRRLLAIGAGLALLLVGTPVLAANPNGGAQCPPGQTTCHAWGGGPGTPGNPGGGGNTGGGNSGGGGNRKCYDQGQEIPCYDDVLGWWNPSDGCRYKLAEPQGSDVPAGKTRYWRTCAGDGMGSFEAVNLDSPPTGFEAPPSPAEVALRLLATIEMKHPVISTAPGVDGAGLVGLPVWLWIDSGLPYWGRIADSRTEQSVRVSLTARAHKVVWDLGDGSPPISCDNPGERYTPAKASKTPKCGRPGGYPKSSKDRPGGHYTVTATVYWEVDWRSGDLEGSFADQTRQSSVNIQIDELQVVTG